MTPMMEQYFEIKNQYKDYLLFYRLGDFYEMFFDDAVVASRELDLTLTGRDCGEEERAPMCGVPFHAVDEYIGKLIEKGYKVAICEQMEDPALAKGLVRRDVIRVITPGTLIESNLLPDQKNNFLCCLCMGEFASGICFADISTAQVYATELTGDGMAARIKNELAAITRARFSATSAGCIWERSASGSLQDPKSCFRTRRRRASTARPQKRRQESSSATG